MKATVGDSHRRSAKTPTKGRVTWDVPASPSNVNLPNAVRGALYDKYACPVGFNAAAADEERALSVLETVALDDFRRFDEDLKVHGAGSASALKHQLGASPPGVDLPMKHEDISGRTEAQASSFELLMMFAKADHTGRPDVADGALASSLQSVPKQAVAHRLHTAHARSIMHNFLPQAHHSDALYASCAAAAVLKPASLDVLSPSRSRLPPQNDAQHNRQSDTRGAELVVMSGCELLTQQCRCAVEEIEQIRATEELMHRALRRERKAAQVQIQRLQAKLQHSDNQIGYLKSAASKSEDNTEQLRKENKLLRSQVGTAEDECTCLGQCWW